MFNVTVSTGGHRGYALLTMSGELDLADAPAVASHLMSAVTEFGPTLIVDMAGLEFIDCCGLGMLARVRKWVRQRGGDMYLAAPGQHVRMILNATGLIDIFSVYPSVQEAASGQLPARSPVGSSLGATPTAGWPAGRWELPLSWRAAAPTAAAR